MKVEILYKGIISYNLKCTKKLPFISIERKDNTIIEKSDVIQLYYNNLDKIINMYIKLFNKENINDVEDVFNQQDVNILSSNKYNCNTIVDYNKDEITNLSDTLFELYKKYHLLYDKKYDIEYDIYKPTYKRYNFIIDFKIIIKNTILELNFVVPLILLYPPAISGSKF